MPPVILVPSVGNPWRSGLFDCCQHPVNAIITTVAPCITFGQIAEILDNGSTSCGTGACLCLLYLLVCNWCIGFRYRRRMRAAFQIAESPVTDLTAHILCCFCALCQEFRELKYRGLDPFRGYQRLTTKILQGQNQLAAQNIPPVKQLMTKGPGLSWDLPNPLIDFDYRVMNVLPQFTLDLHSVFGNAENDGDPPAQPGHQVPTSLKAPFTSYSSSGGCSGSNYSATEQPYSPPSPALALSVAKGTFTYEELKLATNGFSRANLLGEGGFGFVHKGMLPDRKEVAVKQLKAGSGQGEREFQAEVETISRIHHRHLVTLTGYCIAETQRMLVYEFVPNKTLWFHLHGKDRPTMDWPTRLKIAVGSAKGLSYLHEDCHPKIIHRDIKAANILLDSEFEAKVADFGLARFISDADTHVSTRVMGTFGYLAPEYASSGKLNEKSDVYSFGVVLLELISGNRPIDRTNPGIDGGLVKWARPRLARALEDGNFDSLADPRLQNNYNHSEMARMIACAAACVQHAAHNRPKMGQVVRALEGVVSLPHPTEYIRPGPDDLYRFHVSSDYEDTTDVGEIASRSQEHGDS
ncbi:hypothetical protein MLD38_014082 [Melastoma candidum]|uniref:Uncharacterized protein n=1 Tax=Melastoma candidum TaxID=119954 RepID=A0ACB9RB86_9MYRT|nr:hypothetical protein MLD38_014082 [Melastoma candidum]